MEKSSFDRNVANIRQIIEDLGEKPEREGLANTPQRFMKSLEFLTSGYRADVAQILKSAVFNEDYRDMIIIRDIEIYSLCEHHLLPFYGRCHVGYIPNGKVIGLSKIPRLVEAYTRRFQVQERLTHQISEALHEGLAPLGVGVVIEAFHLCMMMRGVEKQNSYTMTSSMQGCFHNLETRSEFLSLIRSQSRVGTY